MNQESSLAIVVASCDKYSDLWEPLFGEFFKYWPDCPYPVFLVANEMVYQDKRVVTLLAGEDLDWSTTICKALENVKSSHVLFWIDDAFLSEAVCTKKIKSIFDFVLKEDINFLRLRSNPKPEVWMNSEVGILGKEASYRVSLFATIWKRNVFDYIVKPGETPWEFELLGSERSRGLDKFCSVSEDHFRYMHGVERGLWIRPSARKLRKIGYRISFKTRRVMTRGESLIKIYGAFKGWLINKLPERHRKNVLLKIQMLYRIFGIR